MMKKNGWLVSIFISLLSCLLANYVFAFSPASAEISMVCDIWPPTTVTDLAITLTDKPGQIKLGWTAPEENKDKTPATSKSVSGYIIKYAPFGLTKFDGDVHRWWEQANYQLEQTYAQQPGNKEELFVWTDKQIGPVYYFAIRSYDDTNNWSEISAVVAYDDTPPETTLNTSGALFVTAQGNFAPLEYKYTFVAKDDLSGVDYILVSVDGRPWERYREEIIFSSEGEHQIRYKALDLAGNWETAKELTVIVDGTKPKLVNIVPKNGRYLRADKFKWIKAIFSENVSSQSNDWSKDFILRELKTKREVPGSLNYDNSNFSILFIPKETLKDNCWYEVIMKESIVDNVGYPLIEKVHRFATLLRKEVGGWVREENWCIELPPDSLIEDALIEFEKIAGHHGEKIVRPFWLWAQEGIYRIMAYRQEEGVGPERLDGAVELNKPAKLNFNYSTSKKFALGDNLPINLESLKLVKYDELTTSWRQLGDNVNEHDTQSVSASVTKMGEYGLAGYAPPNDSLDDLSNYPNPFAAGRQPTRIQYYLKEDAEVNVVIYDLFGNLVKRFHFSAGEENGGKKELNTLIWDGRNGEGDVVASGGYLCRVEISGGQKRAHKILVIK